MIIFLNGPFGVGKTTTAQLLVERLPHAMVYDPEVMGSYLQYLLKTVDPVADFQEYVLWRTLTVEVARLLRVTYEQTLIVPMTVTRQDYYADILHGFRQLDPEVVCVRLLASVEVLQARIEASDEQQAAVRGWRFDHMVQGLAALSDPVFGVEVPTDTCTPADVVDTILGLLPRVVPNPQ